MEGKIGRIHDHSLSWPGTDTSIKSGVVKLVLRAKAKRELKEINKLGENRNNNDHWNGYGDYRHFQQYFIYIVTGQVY